MYIDKVVNGLLVGHVSEMMKGLDTDGNPFFAAVLQRVRMNCKEMNPYACVYYKNGQMNLDWSAGIEEIGVRIQVGVLKHELMHYLLEHFARGKGLDHRICQLAADMEINSVLREFKDMREHCHEESWDGAYMCVFPRQYDLPDGMSFEYYYNELVKQQKSGKDMGEGGDEGWQNGEETSAVRMEVEGLIKDAMKQIGTVSSSLEEVLKRFLAPKEISWKEILKRFVGSIISDRKVSTWRMNSVFNPWGEIKGVVRGYDKKVLAVYDVSGSMNSSIINKGLCELKNILAVNRAEMTLIQCDTDIVWKDKVKKYNDISFERKGSGGTDFRPAFTFADRGKFDLVIFLTDGAGFYPDKVPACAGKVIWLVTDDGTISVPYGKKIVYKETV
jgi:predicted metal-dependent peptidase